MFSEADSTFRLLCWRITLLRTSSGRFILPDYLTSSCKAAPALTARRRTVGTVAHRGQGSLTKPVFSLPRHAPNASFLSSLHRRQRRVRPPAAEGRRLANDAGRLGQGSRRSGAAAGTHRTNTPAGSCSRKRRWPAEQPRNRRRWRARRGSTCCGRRGWDGCGCWGRGQGKGRGCATPCEG